MTAKDDESNKSIDSIGGGDSSEIAPSRSSLELTNSAETGSYVTEVIEVDDETGSHDNADQVLSDASHAQSSDSGASVSTDAQRILVVAASLALALCFVLGCFILPAIHAEPRHIPVGVTGDQQYVPEVKKALTESSKDFWKVKEYPDRNALVRATKNREIYGGVVFSATDPEIVKATGASPVIAQPLDYTFSMMMSRGAVQPISTDVAPLPKNDVRGGLMSGLMWPVIIAAFASALAASRLLRNRQHVVIANIGANLLSALLFAVIIHVFVGASRGNFIAEFFGFAMVMMSLSLCVLGLDLMLGAVGALIGAGLFVVVGYPLALVTTGPEFLRSPWSQLGQALPVGAGAQVLRSVMYFHSAGVMKTLLFTCAWAALGVVIVGIALNRWYRQAIAEVPTTAPVLEDSLTDAQA